MKIKNAPLCAGFVIEALFLCALIAGFFLPRLDPFKMDAARKFLPPSGTNLFGTDNLGRDVCSRALTAVRYSVLFAVSTLAASGVSGITMGLLLSAAHRFVQQAVMRVLDAVNAIPAVLLALVLAAVFGTGKIQLIVTLSVVFFPSFVRITRNEAVKIAALEYIQSARVQGAPQARILFFHILPNIAPPLISAAVITLTNSIIVESVLSYLGMGIQPPVPSLGRMMFEAQSFLLNAPWCALFPGAVIALLSAGFHYIGEGVLRD